MLSYAVNRATGVMGMGCTVRFRSGKRAVTQTELILRQRRNRGTNPKPIAKLLYAYGRCSWCSILVTPYRSIGRNKFNFYRYISNRQIILKVIDVDYSTW